MECPLSFIASFTRLQQFVHSRRPPIFDPYKLFSGFSPLLLEPFTSLENIIRQAERNGVVIEFRNARYH